jgi:hypothetical protein
MDTFESRQQSLGEMVTVKWLEKNHGAGHHLEVYDPDKLHSLMLSRLRKLSQQVESGEIEPMPIRIESLDEIFDSILKSGLLTPVNAIVAGSEEERKIREESEADQFIADSKFKAKINELERRGGQRAVSEFLHNKASKEQKKQFERVFQSGAVTPQSPAPQQATLFHVRAKRADGAIFYVSSDADGRPVALDKNPLNAFNFGASRSQRFAELLLQQRGNEFTVEVVGV